MKLFVTIKGFFLIISKMARSHKAQRPPLRNGAAMLDSVTQYLVVACGVLLACVEFTWCVVCVMVGTVRCLFVV